MKKVKITKRDRYLSLVDLISALKADEVNVIDDFDYDGCVDFLQNEIDLLDKKAVKAKETAKAKKADADALTEAIQEALTEEIVTVNEMVEKLDRKDATPAKVVYRLNALVKAGVAVKADKTVEGAEGAKSRKVVAFRLA